MPNVTTSTSPVPFSVIVPAYNEVESLPHLCEEIGQVFAKHSYDAEVIVVDDGSTDGTRDIYPELCNTWP